MAAVVLPVSAHASELNTSPVYADTNQSYHACNVANVSNPSVSILVEMLNSSGVVIASSALLLLLRALFTSSNKALALPVASRIVALPYLTKSRLASAQI
jgi:hypothetical protein